MYWNKTVLILSCSILLSSGPVRAQDGGEGSPEGIPKTERMPEWVEIQNELSMISAKMNAAYGGMRKLLEEKNHLPENSPKVKELIDELVKQHRELTKLSTQYEQQRAILKYRYPERATKGGFGESVKVQSLQDMEREMTLDGRLDRNINKVRTQFGSKPSRPPKVKTEKSIEESDSLIIRK